MKRESHVESGRLPMFKTRFNALFNEANCTIGDFAKKIGLSRQTTGFYINGHRIPDAETLTEISKALNVSVDWLLGLTDENTVDSTVQSVCEYTGLSAQTVDALHAFERSSFEHNFIKRFLDDLLSDPYLISRICGILKNYAFAEKTAVNQNYSLTRKASDNTLPVCENGKFYIQPSEAAGMYLGEVIGYMSGGINDIIEDMAEEMVRPDHISSANREQFDSFRFSVYSEKE